MGKVESSIEKQSEELAASPLVDGVVENKGRGRLDHLGNPPDISKYLFKNRLQ